MNDMNIFPFYMLEDDDLLFSSYDSRRTLDNSNESCYWQKLNLGPLRQVRRTWLARETNL